MNDGQAAAKTTFFETRRSRPERGERGREREAVSVDDAHVVAGQNICSASERGEGPTEGGRKKE